MIICQNGRCTSELSRSLPWDEYYSVCLLRTCTAEWNSANDTKLDVKKEHSI